MAITVVIVDDHQGFRSFARALLEADGFLVLAEAGDAAGAVAACDRFDPDLVLLDVVLPGPDGFDVCEQVTDGRRPLVVLTSTRPASEYAERLRGCPARGFVAKDELTGATLRSMIEAGE